MKPGDPLPDHGLIIADVENLEDLHKWTLKYSEDTLFAGAFGFFNSLLQHLNYTREIQDVQYLPFRTPALFLLGSYFPKDIRALIHTGSEQGVEMTVAKSVQKANINQHERFAGL